MAQRATHAQETVLGLIYYIAQVQFGFRAIALKDRCHATDPRVASRADYVAMLAASA